MVHTHFAPNNLFPPKNQSPIITHAAFLDDLLEWNVTEHSRTSKSRCIALMAFELPAFHKAGGAIWPDGQAFE